MNIRRHAIVLVCGLALVAGCTSTSTSSGSAATSPPGTAAGAGPAGTVASADPAKAAAVDQVVLEAMDRQHLRSAIVRVTIDGQDVITKAYGESMTGVPAATDMHFRNGAVAIAYVANLLLQLVDEGKVRLDEK